ncbi:MAG: hypothetical protein AB1567_08085 [bacterium]
MNVKIVNTAFNEYISASQITDEGGWIYSPNSGDIRINCSHQDTGAFLDPPHYREYYKYAHEEDDGFIGMNSFDIRYSTSPITEGNWASANKCENVQLPYIFLILGLQSDTTYYLACKEMDERGNWSSLSNVIDTKTLTEPEWITSNLTTFDPTPSSVIFTWTPLSYISRVREKQTELNLKKLREAIDSYYKP